MKKEKTVRSYTRKTKSGKSVQVRQHTASYESADEMAKQALKNKKGAGDELKSTKKKIVEDDNDYGFSAADYKEWYNWDMNEDPKNPAALKVEKALKKKLGRKGYQKYFDDISDNYTSRGAGKNFRGLSKLFESSTTSTKSKNASVSITSAKDKGSIGKGSKHYSDEGSTSKNIAKEVSLGLMSREKAYALTGLKKYAPKVTTSTKTSKATKVSSASSFMDEYKDMNALREYASQVMDSTAPYKAKTRKELKRMFDADQGKTGSHEKKFKKFLKDEWLPNKDNVKGDRNFYLGIKTHKKVKNFKVSKPKAPLTSLQKHAINALYNRPGWNDKNAEKYVRSISKRDLYKILRRGDEE